MSTDKTLFHSDSTPAPEKKKGGPPNRMNDLSYSVWMKFQKSFIFDETDEKHINDGILFFTKSVWPNGEKSKTLVLGFPNYNASKISDSRAVVHFPEIESLEAILNKLNDYKKGKLSFDYITIDFRSIIVNDESYKHFSALKGEFFQSLKSILRAERYCNIVVTQPQKASSNYPYAWSVALSSRDYLKLRDEKILLSKSNEELTYLLFFQSADDVFSSKELNINNYNSSSKRNYPTWTIPKPPPRKKNEILHPAKYPETLVNTFIECFTKPGDFVFDPMVGTGSTVIAAMGSGRYGVGSDLSEEFLDIAIKRAKATALPSLFDDTPKYCLFHADATDLFNNKVLNSFSIDYVVTSPPYWSMLNNSGSENQKNRRDKGLKLNYSDNENDLGNIHDYDEFIALLKNVYSGVAQFLKSGSVLTVVVKNVKRNHTVYPLAWDLTETLCGEEGCYEFLGTTFWCQDDIGLKPFAVGTHWVSNTLHQYCLHYVRK